MSSLLTQLQYHIDFSQEQKELLSLVRQLSIIEIRAQIFIHLSIRQKQQEKLQYHYHIIGEVI